MTKALSHMQYLSACKLQTFNRCMWGEVSIHFGLTFFFFENEWADLRKLTTIMECLYKLSCMKTSHSIFLLRGKKKEKMFLKRKMTTVEGKAVIKIHIYFLCACVCVLVPVWETKSDSTYRRKNKRRKSITPVFFFCGWWGC